MDLSPTPPPPPPPPPQHDDPAITQFRPRWGQWELNDDNINRVDPKTGQTILHNYCKCINTTPLEVYRYLIETMGGDINAQDNNKNTPLHFAFHSFNPSWGGDIDVLMYLLNRKDVNVNIKGEDDTTLLHAACENIHELQLDVFKLLIETMGGDINAQANNNDTPLHRAFHRFCPTEDGGDITILTYLFSQNGVNVNIKGEYGYTLLYLACKHINTLPLDVFELLIETLGCDVNLQANNKNTPIHTALEYFRPNDGDINVLTYLISQKGINVNIKGLYGNTLLHMACDNVNTLPLEIFTVLIETMGCDVNTQDNGGNSPLHHALRLFDLDDGGNITVLTYLLTQKGVNVNTNGENCNTLLHAACDNINRLQLDIFELLIEKRGCDVNVQDNNNDTPLHNAFRIFEPNWGGDVGVLTYLLSQNGVSVNIKGKYGYTLLHMACEKINTLPIEIFKLLIETLGCDVNVQDDGKNTPIHDALLHIDSYNDGNITILTYLLSRKDVNVNIKNYSGFTFLHAACDNINHLPHDVFKLLIEAHGADVNAQDNDKNTPIHRALSCFKLDDKADINVLTYLINQNNLNVNIKGKEGRNLLHLTCINNLSIDTVLCQIVERAIEQVLNESTLSNKV